MIRLIEDNILNALMAESQKAGSPLAVMQIERCPEDFNLRMVTSSYGAVWIHFGGIDSSEMRGAGGGIQDDIHYFDVYVITRSLRPGTDAAVTDEGTAYVIMPEIRKTLSGFRPAPGFKPMYMKKSELVGKTEEYWQYAMRFATKGRYYYEEHETPLGISRKMTFQGTNRTIIVEKEEAENG